MGQGSSSSGKAIPEPGPPKKRKSVIEKVAGTVKKFTTRKKKDKGNEPVKNLADAGKYILKPGGQFVGAAYARERAKLHKKRSVVGNVVHNVKKKMRPKPKWDDSKPEHDKIRKNHSELDDYVEKKPHQTVVMKPKQKGNNLSDGVPDDSGYGGFSPEATVFAHGIGQEGGGGGGYFGHDVDGGGEMMQHFAVL